jgi:hypothetical protein
MEEVGWSSDCDLILIASALADESGPGILDLDCIVSPPSTPASLHCMHRYSMEL